MEADDLLCSRNARPEKALVGRAQSAPIPREITSKLGKILFCSLAAALLDAEFLGRLLEAVAFLRRVA